MRRVVPVLLLFFLPTAAEQLHFAADRPVDLRHLRLDARVDLKAKTLEGRATLDLVALRDVTSVRFDAVGFRVAAVAAGQPLRFANDGRTLEVFLAETLRRGAPLRLTVDYVVRDPDAGLYFFGPTPQQPDVPYQVWSQGETTDNRHWLPLFDHPNERLTNELHITVEKGQQVLSNGALVDRKENGDGTETWSWKTELDHVPYLITLVVGKFAIVRETWRGKPVEYWVPPDREADVARSFDKTVAMLDYFTDKIGVPYPWEKYVQVVVEQFKHGGMENTSATTLTERTMHDARAHLDTSSEGLVAHELAHQWFGDLVTCREWAHTWLNEGFATYFEALWDEHARGADDFAFTMWGKMGGALAAGWKAPVVWRAYKSEWDQFDGRTYPKGAWILHMVRCRLGDDLWWACVKRYLETHAHQCVDTDDLRKVIEAETGISFERFFHDWTARPGHPQVEVTHAWDEGKKTMEVRVRQTQKGDPFHFPLRLQYRCGDAELAVPHDVTESDVRFFVPLPSRPTLVRVDPGNAVLMELTEKKGRDWWVAQLTKDPNVIARIRAARHFGASRRADDRDALADALGSESFWGVQAEIADALGKSGGDRSRDILLQALSLEHPKARRAVVKALSTYKDDATVRDALGALVRAGDPSYYVEADAIRGWAAMRPPEAFGQLEQLALRDSHKEVILAPLLEGIS